MSNHLQNYIWNKPHTLSYSIVPSSVAEGYLIVELFENGEKIRGRHAKITRPEAIAYVKECWRYLLRTPAKSQNKLSSYQRSLKTNTIH